MNGNSLTSSAGMAENEPGLRHRFSAHATPQDMIATVSQYPTGIRTCPRGRRKCWPDCSPLALLASRQSSHRVPFPGIGHTWTV